MELGKEQRAALNVDNPAKDDPARQGAWQRLAQDRGKAVPSPEPYHGLLYSRVCQRMNIQPELRKQKAFEYFLLLRDPELDPATGEVKAVTCLDLSSASSQIDALTSCPCVSFHFNARGADRLYDVTSKNLPTGAEGNRIYRHLAIVMDGQIMVTPRINSAIRADGQISGSFTQRKVDDLVRILRAGALPATLRPYPVAEIEVGGDAGQK
jgi:preprotein translocase subunit SecD